MKRPLSCILAITMFFTLMITNVFATNSVQYDIDGIRHGNAIFYIGIDEDEWTFSAVDNRKKKNADYEATVWIDGEKIYYSNELRDGRVVEGKADESQYVYGTHTIKIEVEMLNHSMVYSEQNNFGNKESDDNNNNNEMLGSWNVSNKGIISGWALIAERQSEYAEVHFYKDGPKETGTFIKSIISNSVEREDLYWSGIIKDKNNIKHGFEINAKDLDIDAGTSWLYAYAVDSVGDATEKEIGHYKVIVEDMLGGIDNNSSDNLMSGWAVIPNNQWAAARIDLYYDGTAESGTFIKSIYADNIEREELYDNGIVSTKNNTWHGFEVEIDSLNLPIDAKKVYAYAVDPYSGTAKTILLGNKNIEINEIDNEPPILSYELETTDWTNNNYDINITVTDESGVKWIYSYSDFTWKSGENNHTVEETYTAWINGNYVFQVWDKNDNDKQYTIPINNIDKLPPFGFFYNQHTENGKTYVDLKVIDIPGLGLSGVKTIKYSYSNGRGVGNYPTDWTTITVDNDGVLKKIISIPIDGKKEKFIFIQLEDYAGNWYKPKLGYGPFKGSTSEFDLTGIKPTKYYDQNLNKYCYKLEPILEGDNLIVDEYKWEILSGNDKIGLYNSDTGDPFIRVTEQNGGGTATIRLSVKIGEQWYIKEIHVTIQSPIIISLSEKYKKVKEVVVNLDFFDDAVTKQYKISENGQWLNYTDSFTIYENTTIYVKCIDVDGKEHNDSVEIINIDNIPPIGTIEYSTSDLTNQDVTATLLINEENSIVTNNNGSFKYVFDNNGEFTFTFTDEAGNEGSIVATVNNIDKIPPNAYIDYSNTQITNNPVVATLIPNEEIIILNEDAIYTHVFTQNGTFTFLYSDLAGNTSSTIAQVNNIDNILPTADFNYDITTNTNSDVTVTLIPNEQVTIVNNNSMDTYTFTENGEFTFEMIDLAGNTGYATATVDYIDKEANASIVYSITEPTYENVTATLQSYEEIIITNNDGIDEFIFTENGEFEFEFHDVLGNEGSVTAVVNNIMVNNDTDVSLLELESSGAEQSKTSVIQGGSLVFNIKTITDKNGQLRLELHCFDMNTNNGDFSDDFYESIVQRGTIKDTFGNIYTLQKTDDGSRRLILNSINSLNKGIEYQIKIAISIGDLPKDSYKIELLDNNQCLQIDVVEIPPLL